MDKFRADVRANLDRELKGVLTSRLKADVVQKLVDAYPDLELPPRMVANEARALAEQAQEQAKQQGQVTVAALPESFEHLARRRVAAGVNMADQFRIAIEMRRVRARVAGGEANRVQGVQIVRTEPTDLCHAGA